MPLIRKKMSWMAWQLIPISLEFSQKLAHGIVIDDAHAFPGIVTTVKMQALQWMPISWNSVAIDYLCMV